jgi:DNA-binding CsgD family transcriptional regulator
VRKCIGWLTPREQEVASLVITGLSNKQVGRELDLEEGTVKAHLSNIYRKTGVKNRTALAAMIIRAASRQPDDAPVCSLSEPVALAEQMFGGLYPSRH